jgi:glycolate oxidase iron-sulfur subunit
MATPELLPLYDTIAQCNRCGFCQAGCPVFRVTGEEHSLARGRQAIARSLILGTMDLSPEVVGALEDCLLCRGCTAHCFPGIRTDEIVTAIRHAYLQRHGQPAWRRILFRNILSDSRKLQFAGRMALWAKRHGLATAAGKTGLLGPETSRLSVANRVMPPMNARPFLREEQHQLPAPRQVLHRVGYFSSCGLSFQYPEVVGATLRVLARNGCELTLLDNTCCGRPAHAYGDLDAARDIARKNLDRMAGTLHLDAIVSECGSCSTFLKEYGTLLKDDPVYAGKAEALAGKVRSFSEFLMGAGLAEGLGPVSGTVTYHDPCHLSNRFGKITAQPRKLLKSVPDLAYRELPEADWCCGAAGSYTFMHHTEAKGVLDRKMANVAKTGAQILATECPACMMHLEYGARSAGLPVRVRHLSQILDEAYAAVGGPEPPTSR